MNKKVNTLLFILGATFFNVIITIAFLFALLWLYSVTIMPFFKEGSGWILAVIFILSIALSYIIYRFVIKLLIKKVPVEKYFDPIFNRRRK